jgi:uncharacterized membrane protein
LKDTQSACRAIQSASTEAQVVAIVREYLSSLTPAQLAVLPVSLTALGVSHVEEVVQSALQLVHREMLSALDAPEAALLKDAALVFSTAAQRLAVLAKLPGETATK